MGVPEVKTYLASIGSVHRYGEDAVTDWGDSAPGGVDLDIGGSPQFGPDGEMLNMDGSSDYAFKIAQSHLPSGNIQRSFAIGGRNHVFPATWVGIIDYGGTAASTRFLVRLLPDRKLEVLLGAGNTWTSDDPVGVDLEQWMIVITITTGATTAGIKAYYKDAEIAGTAIGSTTINTTSPSNLAVGLQNGSALYYNGDIDFFEVFTGVLTPAQVATAWEEYLFSQNDATRGALYKQRDTFPLFLQTSARSNTHGWEDMSVNNRPLLHQNTPDRDDWHNGNLVWTILDGINEGGERTESGNLTKIRLDFHLEYLDGYAGCLFAFNDKAGDEAIWFDFLLDDADISVFCNYWNGSVDAGTSSGGGSYDDGDKILVSVEATIDGAGIGIEVFFDGVSQGTSTNATNLFPSGFDFDTVSLGYNYKGAAQSDFCQVKYEFMSVCLDFPTAQQHSDFVDVFDGTTEYLPPSSPVGDLLASLGFKQWAQYPSGRVSMDEIGKVDVQMNPLGAWEESPVEGTHRMGQMNLDAADADFWYVPGIELDSDNSAALTVFGVTTINADFPSGSDLIFLSGWNSYLDDTRLRISGNEAHIHKSQEDGATNNVNLGTNKFVVGQRRTWSHVIDRPNNTQTAHGGPTDTDSETNVAWTWNDTFGDGWSATGTRELSQLGIGFGQIALSHANHQLIDTEVAIDYVPPVAASFGRLRRELLIEQRQ